MLRFRLTKLLLLLAAFPGIGHAEECPRQFEALSEKAEGKEIPPVVNGAGAQWTEQQLAAARQSLNSLLSKGRACLASERGKKLLAEFQKKQLWKDIAVMAGGEIATNEVMDVSTFIAVNGWDEFIKNPAAWETDLVQDAVWTFPEDLVMFAGPILSEGRGRLALGINAALFNSIMVPKRFGDRAVYRAALDINRPDLSSDEKDHAADNRRNVLLAWNVPLTIYRATLYELMVGTSCLIPGSQWVRALSSGRKLILQVGAQSASNVANMEWRKQLIQPLPEPPRQSDKKDPGKDGMTAP
jgi:hypothetical protein